MVLLNTTCLLNSNNITRIIILKCKEKEATDIPPSISLNQTSLRIIYSMTFKAMLALSLRKITSNTNPASTLPFPWWIKLTHLTPSLRTRLLLNSMAVLIPKISGLSPILSRHLQVPHSRATNLILKCSKMCTISNTHNTLINSQINLEAKHLSLLTISRISTPRMALLSSSSQQNLTKISKGISNTINKLRALPRLGHLKEAPILKTTKPLTLMILNSLTLTKVSLLLIFQINPELLIFQISKIINISRSSLNNSTNNFKASSLLLIKMHLLNTSNLQFSNNNSSKWHTNRNIQDKHLFSKTSISLLCSILNNSHKIKSHKTFKDSHHSSSSLKWPQRTRARIFLWTCLNHLNSKSHHLFKTKFSILGSNKLWVNSPTLSINKFQLNKMQLLFLNKLLLLSQIKDFHKL